MAPLPRSIYTERGSGENRAEEELEQWEELAKRNLIRPSHATRINLFAKERATPGTVPNSANSPSDHSSTPRVTDVQTPENFETRTPAGETEENLQQRELPVTSDPPSQELTSSQAADLSSAGQSARFQALPKDEQIASLRAHKNLGHPSPERLSTLLRAQS